MPRRPLIVLADDLTGAAEVAAIAHEAGLRAVILTGRARAPAGADVIVLDSDTRLASPAQAAHRVHARLRHLPPHAGFFKKTDSVLRGPVLAELAACAQALGFRRTLLVPANPSLGRVIRDGRYFIAGRPLDRTTFARDPHHPRSTAVVHELLGARTPRPDFVIGGAAAATDITRWAKTADRHTLAAGGADFFRAWLHRQRSRRPASRPCDVWPAGHALLLHGTTAAPATAGALRFNGLRAPSAAKVLAALRHHGAATVSATPLTARDPRASTRIARGFATLARQLHSAGGFRHLLVAGGATAAAVLRALGWSSLEVVRVWGPGVVTLRPSAAPAFTVTLKPGSYPWPAGLCRSLPRVLTS